MRSSLVSIAVIATCLLMLAHEFQRGNCSNVELGPSNPISTAATATSIWSAVPEQFNGQIFAALLSLNYFFAYLSSSDGTTWGDVTTMSSFPVADSTFGQPFIKAFNNQLFVSYLGADGTIYISSSADPTTIPFQQPRPIYIGISGNTSGVVLTNWQNPNGNFLVVGFVLLNRLVFLNSTDGITFSVWPFQPPVYSGINLQTPALSFVNKALNFGFVGPSTSPTACCAAVYGSTPDGVNWPSTLTSAFPGVRTGAKIFSFSIQSVVVSGVNYPLFATRDDSNNFAAIQFQGASTSFSSFQSPSDFFLLQFQQNNVIYLFSRCSGAEGNFFVCSAVVTLTP